ncbi:MAG TPA: pentapeptide repeat-containing protein, partial [Vampirovibrionales bacterium]
DLYPSQSCLDWKSNVQNDGKPFIFKKEVNFDYSQLLNRSNFGQITFEDKLSFQNAKFYSLEFEGAQFKGIVDFSGSNFHKGLDEQEIQPETTFDSCIFGSQTIFKRVYLGNCLSFYNCTFKNESIINFKEINLSQTAQTVFEFDINKVNKKDNRVFVEFDSCKFKPGQVVFKNCHLEGLKVKNMTYEAFRFENCTWNETSIMHFPDMKVFNDGTSPNEIQQPENCNLQMEKYADLKNKMKSAGNDQLASHFHFWFLYAKYHGLNPGIEKFILHCYLHLCGFGLSTWRPFILWIFILCIMPIFFWLFSSNSFEGELDTFYKISFNASTVLFNPFNTSELIRTLNFDSSYPLNVKSSSFFLLYFLERIIQGFFIFEVGSAIRNKVKK